MIESVLQALAEWPPALVYALIGVACFVETFFPPSPSDVFVLMASFLSHGGGYDPAAIWFTAWLGGLAGTIAVYASAARFGSRFIESRAGQALLPPDALAFLLKQYGRYGAAGLFLTRLLPGFRSVVAPFAGLNRLPRPKFFLTIAVATALWYATLVLIGTRAGTQWNVITAVLDRLLSTLGVVAVVVALLLFAGYLLWRRRKTT